MLDRGEAGGVERLGAGTVRNTDGRKYQRTWGGLECLLMKGLGAGAAWQCPPLSPRPLQGVSRSIPVPWQPSPLQRRALPPPCTVQQPGLGEEAFVIPACWEETGNSHGEQSFQGVLLSICSPALTATPISQCSGTAGGGCAGHVSGRSPGHPLLGQSVVYSKMVAPGAFLGDSPAEQIAAVQRGPHQCHLHALALGEPLAFSLARIIPGRVLWSSACSTCAWLVGEALLFVETMLSPF